MTIQVYIYTQNKLRTPMATSICPKICENSWSKRPPKNTRQKHLSTRPRWTEQRTVPENIPDIQYPRVSASQTKRNPVTGEIVFPSTSDTHWRLLSLWRMHCGSVYTTINDWRRQVSYYDLLLVWPALDKDNNADRIMWAVLEVLLIMSWSVHLYDYGSVRSLLTNSVLFWAVLHPHTAQPRHVSSSWNEDMYSPLTAATFMCWTYENRRLRIRKLASFGEEHPSCL